MRLNVGAVLSVVAVDINVLGKSRSGNRRERDARGKEGLELHPRKSPPHWIAEYKCGLVIEA